jgi:hypothetical protein
MTEAVTINNEELAILCDIVSGWGVKKWAENPDTAKKQALDRLIAHGYVQSAQESFRYKISTYNQDRDSFRPALRRNKRWIGTVSLDIASWPHAATLAGSKGPISRPIRCIVLVPSPSSRATIRPASRRRQPRRMAGHLGHGSHTLPVRRQPAGAGMAGRWCCAGATVPDRPSPGPARRSFYGRRTFPQRLVAGG